MKTLSPTGRLIEQEVERFGPMTFYQFVELALYHPWYGYYNQKKLRRGLGGDYFTSLQVSPLFPQIFADVLIKMREVLETSQFTLIEMGSGGGEFLEGVYKTLLEQGELKGLRVWAVEKSRTARENLFRVLSRFPKCRVVGSLEDIDPGIGLEGCVVSNEFFDALPFHRLRFHSSGWKEIYVGLEKGELVETEGPLSDVNLIQKNNLSQWEFSDGQELEVRPQIEGLMEEWSTLFSRGYVTTFDYGYPRSSLLSPHRMNGTWQCYRQHKVHQKPLENIGDQDITAHVDFTQLAEAGQQNGFEAPLFCSQGIFLSYRGKERFQNFLKGGSPEDSFKRAGAVQQLLHPSAMGEAFSILVQTKGVSLPSSY